MSWYRMHRGWMDDRIWSRDKYSKRDAWCWIIENAMFEDYEYFIKGKTVIVKKGSLIFTERQLADKWKWGRQKVRTFLKHLQNDQKIVLNLTQGITQISVMNYVTYQDKQPKKKPLRNPRVTQEQPTTEEGKEVEEGKEDIYALKFINFWKEYPKREGSNPKAPAEKKFIKHCMDGVSPDEIIDGAKRYAMQEVDTRERKFISQSITWLNQLCWKDEYSKPHKQHMETAADYGMEETDEIVVTKFAFGKAARND